MWRVSPGQLSGRVTNPGCRKWNSVSEGTTLMPSPARTMPITVASWSTSISVRICSGCSAASRYWRTLLVRDTGLGKGSQVLVVRAHSPYKNVAELFAAARANVRRGVGRRRERSCA